MMEETAMRRMFAGDVLTTHTQGVTIDVRVTP